jgi:secreted Zn-dependent insulinase-like peptidase
MSTPVQLQGLPHLLEHMLFNGNSKYPEPEAFYKFATANAGSVGATTGLDFTEYRFSVSSTALNGALDQ